MDNLELEMKLKALIIETLKLEDISVEDIASEEPLFGTGLGLDSIDGLELGVALRKRFDLKIDTINDEVKAHFATVRAMAQFIDAQSGSSSDAVA